MANSPKPKTPKNPSPRVGKAKGGRPTRAEALRKRALACGVDPATVDPLRVLAGLAIDASAPAAARVAACRVLLAHSSRLLSLQPPQKIEADEVIEDDALTVRALALMAGRGGLQ